MLVGLLPSPNRALAQENTITGDWELDYAIYRVWRSDGSIYDTNQSATMVARLTEVENRLTGSFIAATPSTICTGSEINGASQGNQVHWVARYIGSCCPDAEDMFQGTLSEDGQTLTGIVSPVRTGPDCEMWWANVTGTRVATADTESPTVSWVKPEGIIRFEDRGQSYEAYPATKGTVALEVAVTDNAGIRSVLFERFDEINQQWVELTTDSAAPYQASVEVDALSMQWNQIRAVAEDTAGNLTHVTLLIFRLNPTITLDRTEGPRGTEVRVEGKGWLTGDTVSLQFAEAGNEVMQVTVGDDGSFVTEFTVPPDAAFGEQQVIASTTNGFWETDTIFHVTEPVRQFTIHANNVYAGWSVHPSNSPAHTVSSQWVVPAVKCDAPTGSRPWKRSRVAPWVGLWGRGIDPATTWLPQIGTVSQCQNGMTYYKAFAQFFHISKSGGYITPGPSLLPFDVEPGDTVTAVVLYQGRQPDNKLKFYTAISDPSATARGQTGYWEKEWLTDPSVQEVNAAWQGGCIVESQPDGEVENFFKKKEPFGGLAKFTTPLQLSCTVNSKGLDTYSGFSSVFRWDMLPNGRKGGKLAETGLPDPEGKFSVTWKEWR
jgi:hypothetical protein